MSHFYQPNFLKPSHSKWQNIASILNSAKRSKDWKQWKKSWQDLRSITKKKKSEQIEHARGASGGGPPLSSKFGITDELILSTIAPTSITGDTNISETHIDFDFTFNDIMKDHPVAVQSVDYVIPNEGNAVVLNDHIYSKEDIIPSSTTASKKKRPFASAISNL
ncbi:hypothetical protein JTB14_008629 [Gonioctena quinquepunctata]|nr:hypothetical protein JTB14_008629 [Gonioctena quinquepunctata]